MLKYALAALVIVTSAQAETFTADDAADVKTPTQTVQSLWTEADEGCRGGHGDEAKTFAACAARDVYTTILKARNARIPGE